MPDTDSGCAGVRRPVARCSLIALAAREHLAQVAVSASRRDDPGPVGPWRVVPHMLVVAARELGNPVLLLVLVKPDDALIHGVRRCLKFRRGKKERAGPARHVPEAAILAPAAASNSRRIERWQRDSSSQ